MRTAVLASLLSARMAFGLWPQPAMVQMQAQQMQLAPGFTISAVNLTPDLDPAITRAMALSMWHGAPSSEPTATAPILTELRIAVVDAGAKLGLNATAEAYNMTIPGDVTPIGASGIA